MQGPDYTHWHRTYEVAKHWYMKFFPEIEHLIEAGLASKDPTRTAAAQALQVGLDEVINSKEHRWYIGKMSDEEKLERKRRSDEFKARYAE